MSGPASTFHKIESVGLRDRNLKKRTKNLEIEKEVVKSWVEKLLVEKTPYYKGPCRSRDSSLSQTKKTNNHISPGLNVSFSPENHSQTTVPKRHKLSLEIYGELNFHRRSLEVRRQFYEDRYQEWRRDEDTRHRPVPTGWNRP